MAGVCNYYCTMIDLTFLQLLILSAAFATILKIVEAVEGHSQVFVQTDSELRYLVDGISVQLQESLRSGSTSVSFTDVDDDNLHMYASPIRFEPSQLDFKEHPVGMPAMEKVVIINPSRDTSIHMLSISGSTTDFHCSFFVDKSIPPGGNTTFDVVFLGRDEGSIENTLFIHTSLGSFKYQVKAQGIPNPYRLKPFLGVRMPLNSSYSPTIQMHNPYSSTLQVTEMYSSGGDLHLELPSGEAEGSKNIWEIPPFETKSVMKASFIARIENNHTAFIRIKTNSSLNGNLILPVEVEVSSVPGIYSPIESLDFGVMRSQDAVKTLSLQLINYGQKQIHIQNVIVTPVNDAVVVNFQTIKVPPDTLHPTTIATISYDPAKAIHPKQYLGKIVVKSKNTQFKLTIPYRVIMLQGSLLFDTDNTRFYLKESSKENFVQRGLSITNTFNVSIIVYDYKLIGEVTSFMKVNNFKPIVMEPTQTALLMDLEIVSSKAFSTNSLLRLYTNISYFDLPVLCYNGKLKKYTIPDLNEERLNIGTLGTGEKRDIYFVLINENPIEICLKSYRSNLTRSFIELVGVEKGNLTNIIQRQSFSGMSRSLIIEPHHYIVFRLGVTSPDVQGISYGEIIVETSYETIKLPVIFSTVMGSLNSDLILFENAFPGKVSWKPLQIHSSFLHSMTVTSVEPVPADSRFYFDALKSPPSLLKPGIKNFVGKIYFDPTRKCFPDCYTGLPVNSAIGQKWLLGLSAPLDVGDIDHEIYQTLRKRWDELNRIGQNSMNITFEINTNDLKGFRLQAQANLHWPHLANKQKIKFPLTQIGNTTIREFALENPSGLPVIAQVVVLPMYPSPAPVVKVLQPKLADEILTSLNNENKGLFTLQDTEIYNPAVDNPVTSYRRSIKEFFRVEPLNTSIALLLMPGMRVQIRIGFSPKDEAFHSSLILIRNNLTVLDSLLIQGQGGYGQLKFGNKKPGSLSPLQFEILEKHLKDCIKPKTDDTPPNFTVKRSFTARNSGELPIYFHGFAINGMSCEGFGFKILNCHSFVLQPNDSKKIDIAFTPDFTMSRVYRILNIFSSLSPDGMILNYSLIATIPPHLMLQCSTVIPRPKWEQSLMYILLSMVLMLMVCVSLTAYVEGNRILTLSFLPMISSVFPCADEYEKEKVLDLKKLVLQNEEKPKSMEGQKLNNYYHSKKQRTTSATDTSSNIFNMAFKGKRLNNWASNKMTTIENNASREKDFCNNNNNTLHTKDMESELEHSMNNKCVNRKRTKRLSLTDNVFGMETGDNSKGAYESTSHLRRWSNLFQASSSSFKKNIIEPVKLKSNNNNNNKSGKDNKIGNCSNNDGETCSEKCSKSKTKIKKTVIRQDTPDTKLKKSKSQDGGEDDDASTTTESSNTDVDLNEKCPKTGDHPSLQKKTGQKSFKSKGKDVENLVKNQEDNEEEDDDKDFELSSKSKAHRKIKIDHTKVYGGDILRPNTLELPYRLKTVSSFKEDKESKKTANGNNRNNKTPSVKTKEKIPDSVCGHLNNSENVEQGKVLSSPQWDQPKPFLNSDEAFSELARQTEIFAKKHGRPSAENQTNSKLLFNCVHSRQPSAAFTINSESKKQNVKHPGTIGQRHISQMSHILHSEDAVNLLSPGTPQTPSEPSTSPFFSNALAQEKPLPFHHQTEDSGFHNGIKNPFSFTSGDSFTIKDLWDNPPLQEDDQNKTEMNSQWSNFGLDLGACSNPWYPNYKEQSTIWPQKQLFPNLPNHNAVDSLFGPPTLPWDSLWSAGEVNTDTRFPNPCQNGLGSSLSSTAVSLPSSSRVPQEDKRPSESDTESKIKLSAIPGFDPFRTPHQIWQPTSRVMQPDADGNKDWNFSYFSNKSTDH